MTKLEFEQQYADWIPTSPDDPELSAKLFRAGLLAAPCDCGEESCHGWAMRMFAPDPEYLLEKLRPAFEELGYKVAMEKEKRFLAALMN